MSAKRTLQTTVVATLVAAAVGTVALAAETLSTARGPSGVPLLASNDDHDHRESGSGEHWDDDMGRGTGPWVDMKQVLATVTAAGYSDVREIERESRGYELYANDADGRRWEIKIDGRSGEIVGRERE
jgi:hypothetical protein